MSKYDEILEWASRKSIFYPSSEIYPDAPAGLWNFGPYGEAIRRKIIEFWRKEFVQKENMLEIFGSQIMPESVFNASGHLKNLVDPVIECKKCKAFYRADKLIEETTKKEIPEALSEKKFDDLIKKNKIKCPNCKNDFGKTKKVSLMIQSNIGLGGKYPCYLRPETCQSIFLDFSRMVKTMRVTLPKGIAQVGKAFRNEISPRQSLFREIEFSQMEAEVFFDPERINEVEEFNKIKNYKVNILREGKKKIESLKSEDLVNKNIVSGKIVAYYLAKTQQLYEKYGFLKQKLRFREVGKDERAFYAKETWDFEVETSLGWIELVALNNRKDYDIKTHMGGSGKDLRISDEKGNKIVPWVFEISAGVDRTFYAIIDNAFVKEKIKDEERIVLKLNPKIAPYDCAVLPLVKKDKIPNKAKEVLEILKEKGFSVFYDEKGSIGRRYRRLDEVGVTGNITIDFESLKKNDVTLRDRDSTKQVRIKIKDLPEKLCKLLNGEKIGKIGKIIK